MKTKFGLGFGVFVLLFGAAAGCGTTTVVEEGDASTAALPDSSVPDTNPLQPDTPPPQPDTSGPDASGPRRGPRRGRRRRAASALARAKPWPAGRREPQRVIVERRCGSAEPAGPVHRGAGRREGGRHLRRVHGGEDRSCRVPPARTHRVGLRLLRHQEQRLRSQLRVRRERLRRGPFRLRPEWNHLPGGHLHQSWAPSGLLGDLRQGPPVRAASARRSRISQTAGTTVSGEYTAYANTVGRLTPGPCPSTVTGSTSYQYVRVKNDGAMEATVTIANGTPAGTTKPDTVVALYPGRTRRATAPCAWAP